MSGLQASLYLIAAYQLLHALITVANGIDHTDGISRMISTLAHGLTAYLCYAAAREIGQWA